MGSNQLRDERHWRDRAAQMRALALTMADPEARALMEDLANDYDKLADKAAKGDGNTKKSKDAGRLRQSEKRP